MQGDFNASIASVYMVQGSCHGRRLSARFSAAAVCLDPYKAGSFFLCW